MNRDESKHDRRSDPISALIGPDQPAVVRAEVAGRSLLHAGVIVNLTDRTVIVELDDPTLALGISLAPTVEIDLSLDGGPKTLVTSPGSRVDDNPTSRRVELVVQSIVG